MKKLAEKTVLTLLSTLVLAAPVGIVHAQGDAAAGESKAAVCAACHGPAGDSVIAANPKLAGQNPRYIFKQLQDIKGEVRIVPQMMGLLDNLNEQDFEDLAAYYSIQEDSIEGADPELVELGESIYRSGIASLNVAACTACHSPTGQGNAPAGFPALSGQHAEYTAAQLRAFRAGERTNDGTSAPMRILSERLTDREIEALASYVSGLNQGN